MDRLSQPKNVLGAIVVVALASMAFFATSTLGEEFDLVILNGRVIDPESGLDAVRNVGVKDGKIARITKKSIAGTETIDASDHVVAPGFIDMHNHNTAAPFGQKLALRDGVTTPLELEAGVYPIGEWYAALEGKSQSNYGASVGTIPVRENLFNAGYKSKFAGDFLFDMQTPDDTHTSMKWSTQIATDDDIEKVGQMLEEGLKQGALGIGHCPGYMEFGVTQRESNLVQKLAGEHKSFVAIHGRYSSQMPPASGLLGNAEQMAAQAVYGGGLVIQHMTAQTLAVTPAALQVIDDARDKGVEVVAEIYPYNFGSTIAGADYLHPDNYQKNMGRDYKDIIEVSNMKPLTKERYDELVKTAPGTSVLFYNATEETVNSALAHPNTVLGSDSYPYTVKAGGGPAIAWDTPYDGVNGHPRGAGTHARLLRLVREKKVDIPLDLAVAKMSYLIARFLQDNGVAQMAHKGRVQVGADADLTIFDPATVKDNSTQTQGGLPSTGIPYVVVNGTLVVKDSRVLKDVYPGQAIRGPVQSGS
jgi:N-acyl-D-glutamate deacylase